MRRLFTLLLIVCAWTCIPQKVAAETVTFYVYDQGWSQHYAYIYKNNQPVTDGDCKRWPGVQSTTTVFQNGQKAYKWTLDLGSSNKASECNVIFNNNNGSQFPAIGTDWPLVNNGYYNSTGLAFTEVNYEMVATCKGKTVVLPMTHARYRDQPTTNPNKGQLCTTLFTVGFKDETLPGENGDVVQVYLQEKESGTKYGIANSTFGENSYTLAKNTNLKEFYNAAYTTGTSNTFTIKKGSGISYTVGLNTGSIIPYSTSATSTPLGYPISYEIKAKSISLYVNKSVDEVFRSIYSESYANKENVTNKTDLEDYYLVGDIFGNGYKVPFRNTDVNAEDYKMTKQIFLNPNTNKVDSIVYSKIVKKPSSGSFTNLFMSFAPKSLLQDTQRAFGVNDSGDKNLYVENEKWNLLIRPEVFDEKDATAISGAVLICGYRSDSDKRCNGQQCLNPIVPEAESNLDYYIVRLNVTTSTYRLEFYHKPDVLIPASGIRTFCSQMNLALPDEHYKVYSAQDFEMDENNKTLNGKSNGKVILRSLNYIPANEAVVLIYDTETSDGFSKEFEVITDADENPLLTNIEEDWWVHKDRYNGQTYNNLLVPSLFGTTIDNGSYEVKEGRYYYNTRNFALNEFHKTKYWKTLYKENPTEAEELSNYWGFFRSHGIVPAGRAYLSVPKDKLSFDGQLTGDVKEDNDDATTNGEAKYTWVFDEDPWENTTGIRELENVIKQEDNAYYTLQGMKVAHPTKGIYIHNGKKMIIK
mgnify:FL=1